VLRRLASAAVGGFVARRTYTAIQQSSSAERWQRTNHRGEPVTLAEGPAVAAGALASLLIAPCEPAGARSAAFAGIAAASALGALDDLTGATDVKGLRGHLGELRSGTVTTGSVKLFGLMATGLLVGAAARRGRGGVVDAILAGGVVAGSANMANLLDLRPGRASKAFLLASVVPLVSETAGGRSGFGTVVAGPVGAVAATIGDDLAERAMLGDTGANALGAAWGVGAAASMSRSGLFTTLAALSALTLLSERVSFSQLIEQTPPLQFLDGLGRRSS
jgi:UDP-GlcNAc:undecaprenyl-phosphate GlcNAc-1-phosphate transferase